jgi:hypothetical protein
MNAHKFSKVETLALEVFLALFESEKLGILPSITEIGSALAPKDTSREIVTIKYKEGEVAVTFHDPHWGSKERIIENITILSYNFSSHEKIIIPRSEEIKWKEAGAIKVIREGPGLEKLSNLVSFKHEV